MPSATITCPSTLTRRRSSHVRRSSEGQTTGTKAIVPCARVVVFCLWVLLSRFGHAPTLTPLSPVAVEALPSHRVVLSRWAAVLWPPPTSHPASLWTLLLQLVPAVTLGVDHRPCETSPVPSSTFTTSRSPYAGESLGAASQVLHAFRGLPFR